MAAVPGQLVWEMVRGNNAFLVKQFGRGNAKVQFSKEPNNLYNLHSYKFSGLANQKTIGIKSGGSKDELAVVVSLSKPKKANKPIRATRKTIMKKNLVKMAKSVKSQVNDNYYRPDLTKPALARLSAVYRSLQVAKSGTKKRNRQAHK
ncbi:60S ribosomal protein L28 [Rhynchospora pubera]|uniref:60S ribosomal protein L28 n=1 Tax=Rhynchospora pubera TaxID=906938 RepID=A0AAV8GU99_9POAL|nr:60S ribosomal protein L28 [Rhynchospora pubera]